MTICTFCNQNHLNFYPSFYSKYRYGKILPIFDDIKTGDYLEPVRRLGLSINPNTNVNQNNSPTLSLLLCPAFYQNLFKTVSPTQSTIHPSSTQTDQIMLQYIRCRPNTLWVSIWAPQVNDIPYVTQLLGSYGMVCYVKTLTFTRTALANLMYYMYDDQNYYGKTSIINTKLKNIKATDANTITFILFDNINNVKIAGPGAPIKNKIREILKIHFNIPTIKTSIIHINDYFYQTLEYSEILFNDAILARFNTFNFTDYVSHNAMIMELHKNGI